jgi:hypothetical protein
MATLQYIEFEINEGIDLRICPQYQRDAENAPRSAEISE